MSSAPCGFQLSLEIHVRRHLGQLPNLAPLNPVTAVLTAGELVEDQLAKQASLTLEHKLFCIGLRGFEEAKLRIGDDTDSFQSHQRPHNVREIRRQTEGIFIHHLSEVVSQLFEVHLTQLQIQIVFEESLYDGTNCFRIDARL